MANPNVDSMNGNAIVPVEHVDVTDKLSDNTTCAVTNGSDQRLTQFETAFAYSCA